MGFVGNLVSGVAGYAISEMSESHPVRDFCNMNLSSKSLEDIVDEYARKRLDIHGYNNDFARRLHEIARKYEDYDYDGDRY